jgi:UrcA family protein
MAAKMIRPMLAVSLLAMAAPALADQDDGSARLAISTSGIDLATPQGQQALQRRVDNAINRLCGSNTLGTREEAEAIAACRAETRAEVQPQVDAMLMRASLTVTPQR